MENASADQIAAISSLGTLGITLLVVITIVGTLLGGWMLNISLGIVGNRKPGILACVGWIFAMGIVNTMVSTLLMTVAGPFGLILIIPCTVYSTAYMLSLAGDCSVLQGFFAHLLSGFMSFILAVVLVLVVFIPLGVLSKSDNAVGRQIRDMAERFEKLAEAREAREAEALESFGFDMEKLQNVNLPQTSGMETSDSVTSGPVTSDLGAEPSESKSSTFSIPFMKSGSDSKTRSVSEEFKPQKAKRAADGSQLNPFFAE